MFLVGGCLGLGLGLGAPSELVLDNQQPTSETGTNLHLSFVQGLPKRSKVHHHHLSEFVNVRV
ncbi:hypothetical protein HanLR1_Chr07g0249501 [Helianthus annuus]|nr:hypothetical protein HanLR1_Chr07g0249501 [Helianthus annuus]